MTADAEPFDRAVRRQQRARAAPRYAAHAFLHDAIAADIAARVSELGGGFTRLLDLGGRDGRLAAALATPWAVVAEPALMQSAAVRVVADEDRLPFADGSFDLVASAASLHGVNDLPGALVQVRRLLRPGGLFIASFFAGATLNDLRRDLIEVESALTGRAAARVLPMVDPAAAAGLLQRAGFTDPVSDSYMVTVRYAGLAALFAELRGMGEGNALASRVQLRRDVLAAVAARFAARADADGRVAVAVEIVTMTGWAPGPRVSGPVFAAQQ